MCISDGGKDYRTELTRAIRNTERLSEAMIMPNFRPEGYSGSSERLSKASASSRGVVSTTLFALSWWELCWEEARESDFSFSI